jgi:hypothetical protein
MSILGLAHGAYRGRTYRKLNILTLLYDYLDDETVRFYVDQYSTTASGLSSKWRVFSLVVLTIKNRSPLHSLSYPQKNQS